MEPVTRQRAKLAERIAQGGFPALLPLATARRRARWHRDYVEDIVQRDVRSMARIASLDALPRLLELVAGQTARTLNIGDLPGPFGLSRHFRHRDGAEVDIVVEYGAGRISGVEVKASSTVHASDFNGLKALREVCGERFGCGVVGLRGGLPGLSLRASRDLSAVRCFCLTLAAGLCL
jgi:predicted AAA+ superfamily ATPase